MKSGTTIIEGKAAPQGLGLPGGQIQKYINDLERSIRPVSYTHLLFPDDLYQIAMNITDPAGYTTSYGYNARWPVSYTHLILP